MVDVIQKEKAMREKNNKVKISPEKAWEGVAYVCLALTIAGQVFTTMGTFWSLKLFDLFQMSFLYHVTSRCVVLVKDVAMLGLTIGIVIVLIF